jgi:RHS repeat-associated protein
VLYEVRSSGKQGVAPSFMEAEGTTVAAGDEPNLYGVVAYAHAEGIDRPVGLLKRYVGAGIWGYVTPHANWKGEWSYGTLSDGSTCLSAGQGCPSWPGFSWSMDGNPRGTPPPNATVWWGNIIRGQADASGLMYLRNRYYDPKTGRFTQQDPIGLAGGMNLYGFAGGDPVNFSDPFGLCAEKDLNCKALVQMLRAQKGSEFRAAADRYDAMKEGRLYFYSRYQNTSNRDALNVDGDPNTLNFPRFCRHLGQLACSSSSSN